MQINLGLAVAWMHTEKKSERQVLWMEIIPLPSAINMTYLHGYSKAHIRDGIKPIKEVFYFSS